jgi:hypothetical protein
MEITIQTMQGTFIVPQNKVSELIMWLQANAINANQQAVRETRNGRNGATQLISE